jgi:hypothetical protein
MNRYWGVWLNFFTENRIFQGRFRTVPPMVFLSFLAVSPSISILIIYFPYFLYLFLQVSVNSFLKNPSLFFDWKKQSHYDMIIMVSHWVPWPYVFKITILAMFKIYSAFLVFALHFCLYCVRLIFKDNITIWYEWQVCVLISKPSWA